MARSSHTQTPVVTADAAVTLAHEWLRRSRGARPSRSHRRLARLVAHPSGLAFTVAFVDGVMRPEDRRVAARNLATVSRMPANFLELSLRLALRLGGRAAPVAPWLAVPIARRTVRALVGHLVLDARPHRLGRGLRRVRRGGARLNVNLLGEAVLGAQAARARRDGILTLIERSDVDYVSLKVSSVVPPQSPWGFDAAVTAIAEQLLPVFLAAQRTDTFVNLDMEEYRDLDLTIAVFTRVLGDERLRGSRAGIVLQAYLPDAAEAYDRLLAFARARVAGGGTPIKVRLVKGANLSMERVDAEWHGWPLATWHTKEHTDAHYKRLLDRALMPDAIRALRVGVAGHNLFDLAYAWLLARARGVEEGMEVEMLLGMAERVASEVARDCAGVRLYTPVVPPHEFDVAIAYLVRRLEELANPGNFLSSAFRFDEDPGALAREERRFRDSLALVGAEVPARHRGEPVAAPPGFRNQPDTDPSTPQAREWARAIAARIGSTDLGRASLARAWVPDVATADAVVATAVDAGSRWGALPPDTRAATLERAARALEAARTDLVTVMGAEAGKTLDQSDPEVSEAVDFARYYADCARRLADVRGAAPVPRRVTLVTPPWNFPVAIPAGSALAALAAGCAVILKPAPAARRCGAVLADALWEAGVPREALQLVDCDEEVVGSALVGDPRVEQIVLTGAFATAQQFSRLNPHTRLLAETSGKNALIVTPSADRDLAVRDVVQSAFAHGGQKCSAASLLILVGSMGSSRRFLAQLRDAATSLVVGVPSSLSSQVGPLIEEPHGALLGALTTLSPGEEWLIEPRPLNDARTLWTPGIRTGVRPGSPAHLVEFFGPMLAVMTVPTLDAAIDAANAVDFGLTAGLHSLDPAEVTQWLARIDAGNLYINRAITGAIVRRQPFGGWKRSAVGPGAKAGGPHYVERLTGWRPAATDEDWRAALASAMASDFAPSDPSGLACERNVLRYVPARAEVRVGEGANAQDVLRVAQAAALASPGTRFTCATRPDAGLAGALAALGVCLTTEPDEEWVARVAGAKEARVRALGAVPDTARIASVTVFDDPVTASARLELFPFLREQAISMTAHRYGTASAMAQRVDLAASRAPR